jgi:hypothetical protein
VKNEYNEVKALGLKQLAIATVQDTTTNNVVDVVPAVEKTPIELKIEETVATVTNKVSGLMTPKKKGSIKTDTKGTDTKEEKETEEKTEEKK